MVPNPYVQYRQAQAETAEPGELVVLMYRGAIKFLQRSLTAMQAHDLAATNTNLLRSQEIIAELSNTLDRSVGDVATNLWKIYEYCQWRLVQANIKKDVAAVEEVLGLLQSLLPAWQEAVRIARVSRDKAGAMPRVARTMVGAAYL
jgi:flagellar secretion chaperone FliS